MLGFLVAALLVLVIPGPGVLYVVTRSISQGQRAGLVSVLGLSVGALVHVAAATVGLSAILVTSATAFGVVKALGAGYLIYLGIRTILGPHSTTGPEVVVARSLYRLFTDGVVVSVLNPKIAVFFLAFLPQFTEPGRGPVPRQVLILGLVYVALALCTDGAYALLASRLRHRLRRHVIRGPLLRYTTGAVYLGLGLSTALANRK